MCGRQLDRGHDLVSGWRSEPVLCPVASETPGVLPKCSGTCQPRSGTVAFRAPSAAWRSQAVSEHGGAGPASWASAPAARLGHHRAAEAPAWATPLRVRTVLVPAPPAACSPEALVGGGWRGTSDGLSCVPCLGTGTPVVLA